MVVSCHKRQGHISATNLTGQLPRSRAGHRVRFALFCKKAGTSLALLEVYKYYACARISPTVVRNVI